MSHKQGLMIGLLAGIVLLPISMGLTKAQKEAVETAQLLVSTGIVLSFFISIIRKLKEESVFSPKTDGMILGLGM